MDAVEFVKEYIRLCKQYENCKSCPLEHNSFCGLSVKGQSQEESKEVVHLVEEWAAAHPRKTRQSVFLKQWPKAKVNSYGVLSVLPCSIDTANYDYSTCKNDCCEQCRREFWSQEVE